MATVIEPDDSAEVATLEVAIGQRRFPSRWESRPDTKSSGTYRLRESPAEADLPKSLGETIWKELPWSNSFPGNPDRSKIVESYLHSIDQLEHYRADVECLVRAACLANIEFRHAAGEIHQSSGDAAVQKKLDAILRENAASWKPIRNVADASLVSQSTEVICATFQTALETAIEQFVTHFFEMLALLVNRQLFGLVEWLPNRCCRYHFFRRVLIREGSEQISTSSRDTFFDDVSGIDPVSGREIIGERTHQDVIRSKQTHRLARHQHDVMNAIRTTVGNSQVIMPPAVIRLVESIPAWLLPFVQVIDGDIFRERIVEQDTQVESASDVVVRHEPILGEKPITLTDIAIAVSETLLPNRFIGVDPAVIIGPYVLTGWGPREVEAERKRREQIYNVTANGDRVTAARRLAPLFTWTTILVSLVTLWLSIQAVRGQGGAAWIALGTVSALGLMWLSAYEHYVARNQPTAHYLATCYTGFLGGLFLLAEWLLAKFTAPLSWWTPVVLIAIAGFSYVLAKRFEAA